MTVDTEAFLEEFEKKIKKLKGVDNIKCFGSILDPKKFKPGKSDFDCIIFGKPDNETKRYIDGTMMELSDKYGLKLDKAKYLHPVPLFMQSELEEEVLKKVIKTPFIAKWREETKESKGISLRERKHGKKPSILTVISEMFWK